MNYSIQSSQRGLSLVELMISMTIGLFLLLLLYTLFASSRQTLGAQRSLAQLQDDQRIAMTMITEVVQQAGFFPDPTVNTRTSAFPAIAPFTTPAQALFGTHSVSAPGDTLTVRYVADTSTPQKTINCVGGMSDAGVVVNQFSVASNQLQCGVGASAAVPLVGGATTTPPQGVSNMQILYGVDTDGNDSVDQYMNATDVANTNNWQNILSIIVTLTFLNPMAGQAGQPATIDATRTIAVMNRT